MGCGCKGDKISPKLVNEKTGELNIRGKLLKLPAAIVVTLLMIVLSPFILAIIWIITINSIFGRDSNLIDLVLFRFKKKPTDSDDSNKADYEMVDDDFNEDDYELVNVDVIK